ncbi:MAG: hypothetical protein ACHQ9S_18660 [Candidatus Binatia bacterium]
MEVRGKCSVVLLTVFSGIFFTAARPAHGISCPAGGAALKVLVHNPTSSDIVSGVTISGGAATHTCSGLADSYTLTISPAQRLVANQDTPFTITGLNSGLWTHHISVSVSPSNTYDEYQKGMVIEAPPTSPSPLTWSYFTTSIKVITAGDGYPAGACGTTCTLRQALYTAAHTTTGSSTPLLIWFGASPGTMTQTADLTVSSGNGYVTLDGADSNGNPWIVGDALAAVWNNQDPFTNVVDLANLTHFVVLGPNNTIKGLAINNTLPTGQTPQKDLIYDSGSHSSTYTHIQAVRLDGGAGSLSGCSSCTVGLVNINETGSVISNVEARSAGARGISLLSGLSPVGQINDSWVHHNFNDNIFVYDAAVARNMVELAGFRASDNVQVGLANGINQTSSSAYYTTKRNVFRNNGNYGVLASASAAPGPSFQNDYVCGNSWDGINIGGYTGAASGTGLTTAYNGGKGIAFGSGIRSGSSLTFDNDSAFTANSSAGFSNASPVTASATNNQWRGLVVPPTPGATPPPCHSSSDVSGLVNCDPIQDYLNVGVGIDGFHPTVPSNVMVKGQTIRVQGTGFNAIDGNPLAGSTCSLGADPTSTPTNCCRMPTKANSCDTSVSPPQGKLGQGNCVTFLNEYGIWEVTSPTSVTPTTAVTSLPAPFGCIGNYGEHVVVSKLNGVGHPLSDQQVYCTNTDPK